MSSFVRGATELFRQLSSRKKERNRAKQSRRLKLAGDNSFIKSLNSVMQLSDFLLKIKLMMFQRAAKEQFQGE
jgi:hypothetical protein